MQIHQTHERPFSALVGHRVELKSLAAPFVPITSAECLPSLTNGYNLQTFLRLLMLGCISVSDCLLGEKVADFFTI